MATHAAVVCRFSDGSYSFLRDDLSADTLTEIQTDASGILNIAGDISWGVANQDKIMTHAMCKIQTDTAGTGVLVSAAVYGTQGEVVCPIQGGGIYVDGGGKLAYPVKAATGMKVKVEFQAAADACTTGSIVVVCKSGKCDVFKAVGSDGANVLFTNKDGNGWGDALAGERVVATYSCYGSTYGVADTGVADGIDGFYIESSQGNLKGLLFPSFPSASHSPPAPWIACNILVNQNDTATLTANV
jgi:hypothetical protein